jgi:exosortase
MDNPASTIAVPTAAAPGAAVATVQPEAGPASTIGALDEFQTELVKAWGRLPNKAFFFILLLAWLALFHFLGNSARGYIKTPSLFGWMYEAYNSPNEVAENDRHGNFIPFLVLGLFWWKREQLLKLPLKIWLPGILLLVFAMGLHVLGFVVQQPRLSIVALFGGVYGLMGLAWGFQWLVRSFFPFFLFMFSVPLSDSANVITFPLRLLVCQLVEFISRELLGISVIREGTQLFDPSRSYQYEVAAACSGIRSLVAVFLLATIYGFFTYRSLWKRLFVMSTAFPLAVLGNLIRMLCIVIAAEAGGQTAGNYVHDGGPMGIFSLLPYVPAIFGVVLVGRYLKPDEPEPSAK